MRIGYFVTFFNVLRLATLVLSQSLDLLYEMHYTTLPSILLCIWIGRSCIFQSNQQWRNAPWTKHLLNVRSRIYKSPCDLSEYSHIATTVLPHTVMVWVAALLTALLAASAVSGQSDLPSVFASVDSASGFVQCVQSGIGSSASFSSQETSDLDSISQVITLSSSYILFLILLPLSSDLGSNI